MSGDPVVRLIIAVVTLFVTVAFFGSEYVFTLPGDFTAIHTQFGQALILWDTTIIGYFFGSSSGSKEKDKTLGNVTNGANKP